MTSILIMCSPNTNKLLTFSLWLLHVATLSIIRKMSGQLLNLQTLVIKLKYFDVLSDFLNKSYKINRKEWKPRTGYWCEANNKYIYQHTAKNLRHFDVFSLFQNYQIDVWRLQPKKINKAMNDVKLTTCISIYCVPPCV